MSQNCGSLIEKLSALLGTYITDEVLLQLDSERTLEGEAESLHAMVVGNPDIKEVLAQLSPNASCQRSAVREVLRGLRDELREASTQRELAYR